MSEPNDELRPSPARRHVAWVDAEGREWASTGNERGVLDARLADGTLTLRIPPGSTAARLGDRFERALRARVAAEDQ